MIIELRMTWVQIKFFNLDIKLNEDRVQKKSIRRKSEERFMREH